MKLKYIVKYSAMIVLLFSFLFLYTCHQKQKEKVITFGVFSGSLWDVPNDDCYKILEETIDQFEKEHEGVKVKFVSGILKEDYSEWISQMALEGNLPDVFMVLPEDFNTFSSVGLLKELDDFIEKDEDFSKEQYYSGCYKAGSYRGHQYALPYESVPTFMFVNKDLLRENGISIPDKEWTTKDFYQICKKVTRDEDRDGSVDQYGCRNYSWLDALYSGGGHIFSQNGTSCNILDRNVLDAIKFYDDLLALSKNQIPSSEDFDLGKVAFQPMTYAEFKTYKPYPWKMKRYFNFDWDCIPMPNGEKMRGESEVETLLIGMNRTTQYPEDAWQFLKEMTYSLETQRKVLTYSEGLSPLIQVTNSSYTQSSLENSVGSNVLIQTEMLHNIMLDAVTKEKFKKYDTVLEYLDSEVFKIVMDDNKDITFQIQELKPRVDAFLQE